MPHLTATTPLGLEQIAAEELHELGLRVDLLHEDEGLVEWRGSLEDVARANRELRCIERIALTAGSFHALHFEELRRKAATIAWERWLDASRRVTFRVTSRASKLYHERGIAERLAGAISDRLGRTVEVRPREDLDDPTADVQLVIVRVERNEVTIRVDSSGERLHRRGYRLATAKAPLRETLAAAVLRASGWRPGAALVDPFCGSGTFAIEAARWSAGIAPGRDRHFAFERWPEFGGGTQASDGSAAELPNVHRVPILASDRDAGAIAAATDNARRGGVLERITLTRRTVSQLEVPADLAPGWIVTNPPYMLRTGTRGSGGRSGGPGQRGGRRRGRGHGRHGSPAADPLRLYEAFGSVLRERFAGWQCTMLTSDDAFARATGLTWEIGPWLNNGGVRVRLLHSVDL